MIISLDYHPVAKDIYKKLNQELPNLSGGTVFKLGDIKVDVESKDGLGGLIEEWLGCWAVKSGFNIFNPKLNGGASQSFPDYYLGKENDGYLEVKTFNSDASPNFDIANFESYCESLSICPSRLFADYLIISYVLSGSKLKLKSIWLKKIWQITCASEKYPLKTQIKRNVIYNIRPSAFHSQVERSRFPSFKSPQDFISALYDTQQQYNGATANRIDFNNILISSGIKLNDLG